MIANKLFKQWRVDGNLSWQGQELDDIELWLRSPTEETLEQEFLRLNPGKWEIVASEKIAEVKHAPYLLQQPQDKRS